MESQKTGLISWFAHNHVAANILMLLFIVGGFISIKNMRTETFPSIDPRMVMVSVVYPGASPNEVEDGVSKRVQEALGGMEGVKRVTSVSLEGVGQTYVALDDFANADDVYRDVETAINSLVSFPPKSAERPVIKKLKVTPNVMTLVLTGDVEEGAIKYWAEHIKDAISTLPGVAQTKLSGVRNYEISIEVPPEHLRKYGLSVQEIAQKVAASSLDIPAGMIVAPDSEHVLRVKSKKYTGHDFSDTVIRALPDGGQLRLGDIAHITDGFEQDDFASRHNGNRAAFVDVFRSDTADTLTVAREVRSYIERVRLPEKLTLSVQKDETFHLKERINLMLRNGVIGFMLVFLVLLLFLDLKLAFWTSASIPVSFLGGLMIIHFLGYSLNMISLFALIVVLGIVVDDAIVVGESVFSAQREHPDDPRSTLRGVMGVIAPVTIGVATTMAAFAPLITSTGTMGQIVMVIPIVVISILFVSLMEAYFILPSHLSSPGFWSRGPIASVRDTVSEHLRVFTQGRLQQLIQTALRYRYKVLLGFIAFFIFTFALVAKGWVRFIFFPPIEGDEVVISVAMPRGTPYAKTEQVMLTIEREVEEVRAKLKAENSDLDSFKSVSMSIGQNFAGANPFVFKSGGGGHHVGQMNIQLAAAHLRGVSSAGIEDKIRARVEKIPGIETLSFRSSPVGGDADVEIEFAHRDVAELEKAVKEIKATLKATDGVKEITDSLALGKEEYVFTLNNQGVAVGLTPAMLGQTLRGAFFGEEVQRIQRGDSEVKVFVRLPEASRQDVGTLSELQIKLPSGQFAPLKSVVDMVPARGYAEINSVDGRQVATLSLKTDYEVLTPNEMVAMLEETILPELMERHPQLHFSFEGEGKEQSEDLKSLFQNMQIALLVIYVLLGAQLRSYTQPIVIMSAIPFGIVGAIWGHVLMGYDLTFISLFGMVALSGVVVNDSVVLVDYFNHQRQEGVPTHASAVNSVLRRFRPILLTTLTTCLGLLPMLMETSLQARFLIPMVISLALGLLFVTVVILILVPVLLMCLNDLHSTISRCSLADKNSNC